MRDGSLQPGKLCLPAMGRRIKSCSCSITQRAALAGEGIKFLIVAGADAQEAAVEVLTQGLPAECRAHLALVHV